MIHRLSNLASTADSLRTAHRELGLEDSFVQAWAENALLVDEGLAGGATLSRFGELTKGTAEHS